MMMVMDPMKSVRRQWWLGGSIIVGAMVVAAVGLYYLSSGLGAESAKIVSDRNFIAQQATLVGTLATLKSEAAQSSPYLAAIQKLLPTHDALIGFPQWVNGLASADGVAATISFTGGNVPASASSPGSDAFSMTVNGSGAGIAAFLNDLETKAAGFMVAIDSFNFSSGSSGNTLMAQGMVFSR